MYSSQRSRRIASFILCCSVLNGCARMTYNHGLGQVQAGQWEMGVSELKQVSDANPTQGEYRIAYLRERDKAVAALYNLVNEAIRSQHYDDAEATCSRIAAIWPDHPKLASTLQRIAEGRQFQQKVNRIRELIKQGDKAHALSLVQVALVETPNNATLLELRRSLEGDKEPSSMAPSINLLGKKPITLEFRDVSLKMLLEALSRSSGLNFILDNDVRSDTSASLFVRHVPLQNALDMMLATSHLRRRVLSSNTVLIYPDRPEKIAQYQDLVVKTFYLTNIDGKRAAELLRSILKIKYVFVDDKLNIVTIRDTPEAVALATRLIANQDLSEPEVMLEVEVLEITRSRAMDLGVELPDKLSFAPIPSNGASILLGDLKHINSQTISVGGATANLHLQDQHGDVNILAAPRIRARNHEKASILIGEKVPIITSTITPTGVTSNNIQYQDVGLKLETEPAVYMDNEVGIKVNLEVSSLGTQTTTTNGTVAYQISTRNATTLLRLKDGETQVLAGLLDDEEHNSSKHVPGLGDLPLIGHLFSETNHNHQKTEIMLAITPRIVRNLRAPDARTATVWSGTDNELRAEPLQLEEPAQANPSQPAEGANAGGQNEPDDNSPAKATLTFEAPKTQLKVGEALPITLKLQADRGLRSLPLQISFDPKLVGIATVSEGEFFKQNSAPTVFSSTISEQDGKVYISAATSELKGVSGKAGLIVLNLVAKSAGQTALSVVTAKPMGGKDRAVTLDSGTPLQLTIQ